MDKDGFPPSGEHQVRLSWKTRIIDSVSVAERMKKPTQKEFRGGVPVAYCRHAPRALFVCENVRHGIQAA
jgi:hypothetical protein